MLGDDVFQVSYGVLALRGNIAVGGVAKMRRVVLARLLVKK